jgi:uncharacterized protein YgiM (DUF1202 family)
MNNVLEFKPKQQTVVQPKQHFWLSFKNVLRKYYSENDVHLIVAAIMDSECYEKTNDDIRKIADIYYKFAPDNNY